MPLPSSIPAASQHARSRKVKLMISHAGKILPRPSDNKLRYVGGETRMISIPRHTRYSGFVQKMLDLYGSNLVLRYQLPDEELDALVTVSCDEDIENMLEECDRLETTDGSQKLRVFVFSSSDLDVDQTKIADPETSQQLYVNAVNAMSMDTPSRKPDNPVLSLSNALSSLSGFDADAWPVTYQMQDILKDQQSGVLPTAAGNVSLLDDLTPDYVSDPVPLVSSEQNKEALLQCDLFPNQSATTTNIHDVPVSKEDFIGLISGAVPGNSLEQEVHHQDSHFRWDSNPQMQKQECLLPFSTGQDSRTDVLSYSQSSDMVNGLESAEKLNWWDEHFSSEPGALLQKEPQTDEHILDILSDGFMVNQSSEQPPLEGWYTQQQIFHKHGDLENQHLAMPAFYNPWSFLAQKNTPFEHTKSTQRTLSTELPASNELQSLPELSFSSVSKGNSGSFGAPNGNVETLEKRDLLSQQAKVHEAYNVPLPDLETTKASDKHRGELGNDVPLLIPDPVSVETSDSVFQTCYGTFSSLQAGIGEQVVALKGLKSIPTFKDTQKQCRFDGEYPVEGLWSETQLSCASSRPDVNSDHLQEESTKASECYFDDHPTIARSTVTSELPISEFEDLSLLEDSICAKTQDKHTANKIVGHKLDPSSSPMDYISTLDMVPNLLKPSRLTHSLPVDNSNMDHLGGDLNAEDGAEPLVMSSLLEPSVGRYDISGSMSFDAVQNSTNLEAIFSQSRHHESTLAHLKASIAIENQGNLDIDELYSAPASSLSAWEASLTEAEHWKHTQMQHITQERGPMLEKAVKFEDTKHEPEDSDDFESISDHSVSALVNAEEEAKARGLQIIRNIDLEELRELGSGTFGTVYHGKWRGTDVAIKRIKSSCFTGRQSERERLIADFWREACILGQLHHPNVVAFYGVVPDGPGGTLATVAEYMVNGSLKQVLAKKDRTLDRRKRLLIAMDAAFGMEYLHSKNVVHFDLKCENLLVNLRDTQRPICKVADLGLSKVKKKTMVSGGVRGTLPWMAPELLNGSSSFVSEKIDVFSFGIVMWELLTGEEPYANMHYGAIIGGIVNNTLRPPVPRWCESEWKLLMERCWSADPSERPTFSQIARSLRAMEASLTARGYVPIAGV